MLAVLAHDDPIFIASLPHNRACWVHAHATIARNYQVHSVDHTP
jgi:hypothetical protein